MSYPVIPAAHGFFDVGYGDPKSPDIHIQFVPVTLSVDFGFVTRNIFIKYKQRVSKNNRYNLNY